MTTYARSAEQLVLEGQTGPELAAALSLVAETEANGQPKFAPDVCRKLNRIVVCRAYASSLLELCHLVVAAGQWGTYEAFFWAGGPARPTAFKGKLTQAPMASNLVVAVGAREITLTYPDGSFAITYARMPLLSAMMEFLVTALGYGEVDQVCDDLSCAQPTAAGVSAAAKALAKRLYAYLNVQLGSLHGQRKLHALIGFMSARNGGDFTLEAIDDEAVLALWLARSHAPEEGADFRTFKSAFKACLRLRQAMASAQSADAINHARPIGSDRAAGEVDPADLCLAVETMSEPADPLERLAKPPAGRVKFLTRSESGEIELVVACGALAPVFPLSILRAEVFGQAQARITQALRRGLELPMAEVVQSAVQDDYESRAARFETLENRLERLMLAGLFVLVDARRAEAIHLILFFRPQAELAPLGRDLAGANVVALDQARLSREILERLSTSEARPVELSQLMGEAKRAFQSISRRGFSQKEIAEQEVIQGFAEGIGVLTELAECLGAFCRRLGTGDGRARFARDREIFERQFQLIYGGSS
ncbi:MAG: hypothetical protein AAF495_14665 [Pseudomonadota bacterium]